jgi:hypothetical protein
MRYLIIGFTMGGRKASPTSDASAWDPVVFKYVDNPPIKIPGGSYKKKNHGNELHHFSPDISTIDGRDRSSKPITSQQPPITNNLFLDGRYFMSTALIQITASREHFLPL